MSDYKLSTEGFILPDFDFDSNDAVIPVSSPAFNPPEFDIMSIFFELRQMIDNNDLEHLSEHLLIFRASIIHIINTDPKSFPAELIEQFNVPETLMTLIDPNVYPHILYESISVAIAWTGAHGEESNYFANPNFINFLIESAIISLSDPQFQGDRRIGNASLGLLRNLLLNSNDIRLMFIHNRGIELFSMLYFELTNPSLNHCILWILHNSLLVEPIQRLETFAPIEKLFKMSFRNQMKGVPALEIGLAIAYVKVHPSYALSFIENVRFEIVTSSIEYAHPDTQLAILDLLEILALYPDNTVAENVFGRIMWEQVYIKIPEIGYSKLSKKLITIAAHFFEVHYKHVLDTFIVDALLIIYSTGKYSIKSRVIDCLYLLLQGNLVIDGMNTILFHKVIPKIIQFFFDSDKKMIKFSAEFLLAIIDVAENNPSFQRDVLQQMDEEELAPILDDLAEDLHEDLAELIGLLRIRYENLSDAFDQMERENKHEEEEIGEMPHIDYRQLSRNHQIIPQQFDASNSSDSNHSEEEIEWETVE